jgi:hypothetical protein
MKHFKENLEFGNLRFKRLDKGFNGYPLFDFDESIIDIVDLETFIKVEGNRIPLFIGTQMGLYPLFYDFPEFYNEDKMIAVLGKSVLSGHVAGLAIYKVDANSKHACYSKEQKVIYFKNEE